MLNQIMDVNGTRFHLLLGRDDWARCLIDDITLADLWSASPPRPDGGNLEWNDYRNELTLRPRLLKHVAAPKDVVPLLESRRGAGRDQFGNWYWIDDSKTKILALSTGSGATSDFWLPGQATRCSQQSRFGQFQPEAEPKPIELTQLSGLAVTQDHYLVVGMLEPAGLLIFDLHAGGEPRRLQWPSEVPFAPFDMAARPGGGVFILDQFNRRYWVLDRNFNVDVKKRDDAVLVEAREEDFQPLQPGDKRAARRRTFPRGIGLDQSSPLKLERPIAIEALRDGTVLILDRSHDPAAKFSLIYRYDFDQQLGKPVSTEVMKTRIEADQTAGFSLVGYDIAFVPEHEEAGVSVPDRLYVASAEGNQSFAFTICVRNGGLVLNPVAEFLPMRLFGGKGLVAAGSYAWYDFTNRWVPLIRQRRPRFEAEAVLATPLFDGREPDCVWHRLMLDACIPPDTKVEIRSRAANDEIDLKLSAWRPEPAPYRRGDGSELPFMPRNSETQPIGEGTWELLFQRARGRFLQLEIKLSGSERATPHLRALRAYYPRFSYLESYLPAVYREDDESASFLDRFLANMEGFYTTLEEKIAAVQVLFDVRSAPKETLDWLANWFGVALDPAWDEAKRRLFIIHAMDFFAARGTARGLKMALRLALEPCADEAIFARHEKPSPQSERIRIVEKFLTRNTPGVVFGDPTDLRGLRQVTLTPRWEPKLGGTNLHQRYTDFKTGGKEIGRPRIEFPIVPPEDAQESAAWQQFSQENLGFIPSSGVIAERSRWQNFLAQEYANVAALNAAHQTRYADFRSVPLPTNQPKVVAASDDWERFVTADQTGSIPIERKRWQNFLARRYRRINALNDLYATAWKGFEMVPLAEKLPIDGAPLLDWFQYESVIPAMHRLAHRFIALLPMPATSSFGLRQLQQQVELARRIIELEKPAHTVFEIKFYWAIFRIGEARLGSDTLVDRGSRAPQLMPKLIMGDNYIGESWLAPTAAEEVADRQVLGRDQLGAGVRFEMKGEG